MTERARGVALGGTHAELLSPLGRSRETPAVPWPSAFPRVRPQALRVGTVLIRASFHVRGTGLSL